MKTRQMCWIFLAWMLVLRSSDAIVCYVCQDCPEPADLNGFTNNTCSGPCMKVKSYIPTRGVYIYKACVRQCTETSYYFGGATFDVKCCSDRDRCNHAGPSSQICGWKQWLILLSLSIILTLARSTNVAGLY